MTGKYEHIESSSMAISLINIVITYCFIIKSRLCLDQEYMVRYKYWMQLDYIKYSLAISLTAFNICVLFTLRSVNPFQTSEKFLNYCAA